MVLLGGTRTSATTHVELVRDTIELTATATIDGKRAWPKMKNEFHGREAIALKVGSRRVNWRLSRTHSLVFGILRLRATAHYPLFLGVDRRD